MTEVVMHLLLKRGENNSLHTLIKIVCGILYSPLEYSLTVTRVQCMSILS